MRTYSIALIATAALIHSTVWAGQQTAVELVDLSALLPGSTDSAAFDISPAGVVIEGVLWDTRAEPIRITPLGKLPGHRLSRALALNETGVVVGFSVDADFLDQRGVQAEWMDFRGAVVAISLASASPVEPASPGKGGHMMKIIDFSKGSPTWHSIDDVVMGGQSSSRMTIEDGVAVFAGTVSLANNGGFASVRSLPVDHDLSAFDRLILKVKGDGRSYKLRLRTTSAFDGVSYQASIAPPADRWHEVELDFDRFEPVYRGRIVAGYEPLDPARVRTIGVLISDGQEGPFRLEIAWIAGTSRQTGEEPDDR